MMREIRADIQKLDTGIPTLEKFARVVGVASGLLGLLLLIRGRRSFIAFFVAAAVLLMVGWMRPQALKALYRGWMAVAICLGWVMSRVLLFVVFYVIITPWGLLLRAFGKDILDQKIQRDAASYWKPKQPSSIAVQDRYTKMF